MKRIIIYTGVSLLLMGFIFFCFAFVLMELNPAKWDLNYRLQYVMFWLMSNLVIVGFITFPKTKTI